MQDHLQNDEVRPEEGGHVAALPDVIYDRDLLTDKTKDTTFVVKFYYRWRDWSVAFALVTNIKTGVTVRMKETTLLDLLKKGTLFKSGNMSESEYDHLAQGIALDKICDLSPKALGIQS